MDNPMDRLTDAAIEAADEIYGEYLFDLDGDQQDIAWKAGRDLLIRAHDRPTFAYERWRIRREP